MNPLSQAYYNMKRQWGAEDYNPYAEAVYGRAMATPTTPNIGGEAIKSLLGAIMASKLGQAKRGYVESERDLERKRGITDRKTMMDYQSKLGREEMDYKVGLQKAQEQETLDRAYRTYLGSISPDGMGVPSVPGGMLPDVYGKLAETNLQKRGLIPSGTKYEFEDGYIVDPVKGIATPVPGYKSKTDIAQSRADATQLKADQNLIRQYRMKRSDLIRQRDSLAMRVNPLTGESLLPEEATIALRGVDSEIKMYDQYLSELGDAVAPPPAPASEVTTATATPVEEKGTIGKVWNAIFGGNEATPPPVQQVQGKRPLAGYFTDTPKPAQPPASRLIEVPREPTELDKLESRKRELLKLQKWTYTDPEVVSISNRMKELRKPAPKSKEAQIKDAKSRMRYLASQLMGNTKGNKEYQELKAKVQLLEGRDFNPGIRSPQTK